MIINTQSFIFSKWDNGQRWPDNLEVVGSNPMLDKTFFSFEKIMKIFSKKCLLKKIFLKRFQWNVSYEMFYMKYFI